MIRKKSLFVYFEKSPYKKWAFIISMIVVTIGFGCLLFYSTHLRKGTFSDPLQLSSLLETVYGIGTVTAIQRFQLQSGVSNTIQAIFVKEGDWVKKNQPLIQVYGTEIFRAPFSGTITALPFKIGENVFSQSIILNLVNLEERYILVSLEQEGIILIKPGQKAKMCFEGIRKEAYEGKVCAVYSNQSDFLVRIDTPELPKCILPGMTADVSILIKEHPKTLLAPIAGVLGGKAIVNRNGKILHFHSIQLGITDGEKVEVLSELQVGDKILIPEKHTP